MCQFPCGTCSGQSFDQCITCADTAASLISNTLCLYQPMYLIQITCTFLILIFVIAPLMRRRCVTLMHLFDCIQFVAYFKYLNGYVPYRHNYLYLGLRSWGDWSEGWKLLDFEGDLTIPIWLNEETLLNKIVRILSMWAAVIIIMLILGFVKTMTGDSNQVTFGMYVSKNWAQALLIGFYINVQDMGFVIAFAFYSLFSVESMYYYILYGSSIIFIAAIIAIVLWMFQLLNYDFDKQLSGTPQKIYPHVYTFCLSMDYDLFPTYELTSLPTHQKKIHRYSNLKIIDVIKKIAYSFLIMSFLFTDNQSLSSQRYAILGFFIFFVVIWYIVLPYDSDTQIIQLILAIIGDILVVVILMANQVFSMEMIELVLCLTLLGLALVSVVWEMCSNVYQIIPVDLYQTGLNVIIEDKKLLEQIENRKRQQAEHQKKLQEMEQRNRKLQQQLQQEKRAKQKRQQQLFRGQSEQSLPNLNQDDKTLEKEIAKEMVEESQPKSLIQQPIHDNESHVTNQPQQALQKASMTSDDLAELYRIDQHKRRKVYQFNKKSHFVYSNKIQQ